MTTHISKALPFPRLREWKTLYGTIWRLLLVSMLVTTLAHAQEQERVYKAGQLYISVSKDGEALSIAAENVPRRDVFGVLYSVFGIEVRPVDAPDETISAKFSDQKLEDAIGQLLPKRSHFIIRTERERRVQAGSGIKEGPKVSTGDRPEKPKEGALGPAPAGKQKPAAKLVRPAEELSIKGGKPLTKASVQVAQAKGPKVARKGVATSKEAVRLSFILRSSGEVVLTNATLVEGKVPQSPLVRGPFMLVIRDAAGIIRYIESQQNPLAQHSYRQDGIHDETRAKEGLFGVWIPRELLDHDGSGLRLQFFDTSKIALPAQLDERTSAHALEQLKPMAELKGEDVLRVLKESDK